MPPEKDAYLVEPLQAELAALLAENERLREERDKFRALVEDASSPGMFGEWHSLNDPMFRKTNLKAMCEMYGFGAVMRQVEFLWRLDAESKGLDGAEITCAATATCRRQWIAAARAALQEPPQ